MLRVFTAISLVQATIALVYLLRLKVFAVLLGPSQYGIVSVVEQAVQWISFLGVLSLPSVAAKWLAEAGDLGENALRRTYTAFFKAALGLSAVVTLAAYVVTVLGPPSILGTLSPYRSLLWLGLLSALPLALEAYFVSALAGLEQLTASLLLALGRALTMAIAGPVGYLIGGLPGLFALSGLCVAICVGSFVLWCNRRYYVKAQPLKQAVWGWSRKDTRLVKFALPEALRRALYPFSYLVARYVTFSAHGAAQAGYLHASLSISDGLFLLLGQANSLYLLPQLSRRLPATEKAIMATEFHEKLVLALSVIAIPLVLFSDVVVNVIFSSAFEPAQRVLHLFVISQCLVLLAGVYQTLLVGMDDFVGFGLLVILGHGLRALLAYVLIPGFGLCGAGWAFLLASLGMFVVAAVRVFQQEKLRWQMFPWKLSLYLGCTILLAKLIQQEIQIGLVWSLLIRVAMWLLVVWGALLIWKGRAWKGLLREIFPGWESLR